MLTHLTYHSIRAKNASDQDIDNILENSRKNNQKNHITGCLIHKNDEFVQIIEGEAFKILDLFEKIKKDDLHHHVSLVNFENISKRIFSGWNMAYKDISKTEAHELNLYLNIINKDLEPELFSELNKYSTYKCFCAIADQVLMAQ